MALKLRLSRGGRKNRPHYSIVVTDSRNPRDGRFIEKVGTYDPLLKKDDENRVKLVEDRIKHWLSQGAKPTDRVSIFLGKAGITDMPEQRNNPQKSQPKKAAQERLKEKAEKAEAAKAAEEEAKAAAEAEANAPAEEAPAEEQAADTPAEDTAAADAPAEENKAEEPATEEAPAEEEKKD
jgi:small subunit ribosomal protein S16